MALRRSFAEAQADLASLLDAAIDQQETVIIERAGHPDVALIAAQELSGLMETLYLLRSPANATRLLAAFEHARRREGEPRTVDELRREVGLGDG